MIPKNNYEHIFFDFDHTLWDFDRCSNEVIEEFYDEYGLEKYDDISLEQFYESFKKINFHFWDLYNHDKITKEQIRDERFPTVFKELKIPFSENIKNIGDEYLQRCPMKPYAIPHAHDILDQLGKDYQLHLITNGFKDVLKIKMKYGKFENYFKTITTSECSGYKKPSPEIFDHALDISGAQKENSIMIGDNVDTDINGARNAGIDCIFFNPMNIESTVPVNFEIHSLNELVEIFYQ